MARDRKRDCGIEEYNSIAGLQQQQVLRNPDSQALLPELLGFNKRQGDPHIP